MLGTHRLSTARRVAHLVTAPCRAGTNQAAELRCCRLSDDSSDHDPPALVDESDTSHNDARLPAACGLPGAAEERKEHGQAPC